MGLRLQATLYAREKEECSLQAMQRRKDFTLYALVVASIIP